MEFASKPKKEDDVIKYLPQLPAKRMKQSWKTSEAPAFFNGQSKLNEVGQQAYNLIEELYASMNIYIYFFCKLIFIFAHSNEVDKNLT